MSRRILVLADHLGAAWCATARRMLGPTEWHLVTAGLNVNRYTTELASVLAGLDVRVVPLSTYVEAAERDVQEFYPRFVFHFPRYAAWRGRTLLQLLRQPDDVNLWWLNETCEKGPVRGRLPHQLYLLALLRRLLTQQPFDEIWLDLADRELRRCIEARATRPGLRVRVFSTPADRSIRAWLVSGASGLPLLRQQVWRALVVLRAAGNAAVVRLAGLASARRLDGRSFIALFSRYPVLWQKPYTLEQQERYFLHLASRLASHIDVAYLVSLTDWPWQVFKRRRALRGLMERQRIQPLVCYLTPSDYLRALAGCGLARRFIWYLLRMSPNARAEFLGWDISGLWDAEIRRSLGGPEIPENLLLMFALRRVISRSAVRCVMHPLEFQPMERAIWAAAQGRTVSVAIQHSTYCRNHFMYFFPDGELGQYIRREVPDPSPTADYYVAAGSLPRDILLEGGVPAGRVGLCGAIRYDDLQVEGPDQERTQAVRAGLGLSTVARVVLVATSISRRESIDLVESLAQVADQLPRGVALLFKCHYHAQIETRIERLFSVQADRGPYRILDVNGPLHDYMRAADVVLAAGSTVGVEALALGRRPVVYHNPTSLNLSPLSGFGGCILTASCPSSLLQALTLALTGGPDSGAFEAARDETISRLFHRLDGRAHERMLECLEKWCLLPRCEGSPAPTRGLASEPC